MTPLDSSPAECLSALADGQLRGVALMHTLEATSQDPQLLADWRDYQLIGDLLRGHSADLQANDAAFLARLRPALKGSSEAPADFQPMPSPAPAVPMAADTFQREAANAPRWRWVAGLASVALVGGLAWSLVSGPQGGAGTLAAGPAPLVVAGPQGAIIRDAALEELMEAHRQQGGASVLPMPSGFLRNATFEASPQAVPAGSR